MKNMLHNRNRKRTHRGFSVVYVGVAMIALFGLVSMAVDMGRVRMVRAQMQAAADAGAFAAVIKMPTADFSSVESAAISIAAANQADNSSVVVQSSDIEFGLWSPITRTFVVLPKGNGDITDARHAANAIRVTTRRTAARGNSVPLYFARIVGVNSSDIRTVATAYIRGGPTKFGIVGLTGIDSNGNRATIDSYPASTGPYNPQTARSRVTAASNGVIDIGNGDIYGDARPGPGKALVHGPNGGASGWTAPLETPLSYPPAVMPGNAIQLPNTSVVAGGTLANPIVYKTTNFPLQKSTSFTGAVKIYVTGSVSLKGNAIVTSGNLPANLQIFVVGSGVVDMNGNTAFYAQVYAPQSNLIFNGTPDFYGAIVAKSILFKGTADIHYDESGGLSGIAFRSVLVQ